VPASRGWADVQRPTSQYARHRRASTARCQIATVEEPAMITIEQVEDLKVIDADTHVVEPYDLWTSRVSKKWGDRVPHVIWDEERQLDVWVSGGEFLWLGAVAGQAGYEKHHPDFPPRFSDLKVDTPRSCIPTSPASAPAISPAWPGTTAIWRWNSCRPTTTS
jgi:hypothetical protein